MASPQAQQDRYAPPRTLNHAAAMIVKLGFGVPSKEDLLAIRNVCGTETLAQALADTLNGDNTEVSKALLSGVLGACAASTRKRIEALGFSSPPTEVLARIGKVEGTQFALMVRDATAGTPSAEGPRNYVALTLARHQEEFDSVPTFPPSASAEDAAPTDTRNYVSQPDVRQEPPFSEHQQATTSSKAAEPVSEEDGYKSSHVYGGSAALCFNTTSSRQNRPTISLDAAAEVPNQPRNYNWADKITVQLSAQEMPLVYAVLMGYMDEFKGAGHGASNDKWFTIKKQQGKIFVSVNRKGSPPRGVPISAGDLYPVISLFMRQLQADSPHLTPALINSIAQRAASICNETNNGGNKD